ncbi:MAG: hypothetical protein RLZZ579_260 [Actinomycetota bacterium]
MNEEQKFLFKVLNRALTFFRIPVAVLILQFQNIFQFLKCLTQKNSVLKAESPNPGQPILVVALWQYGPLREDIKKLFATAQQLGFFVLAVNTGKGQGEQEYENASYYAQIPNFGRDFASYKFAMQTIYRNGWHKNSSRLVLTNDSIFFSEAGLKVFLSASLKSKFRALGATENFEYERHLGSFFLSFDASVFQHKRFIRFWMRYRRSNLRPTVIRRGELGLSKTVKKFIDSNDFRALYDIGSIAERFSTHDVTQADRLFSFAVRAPGPLSWKRTLLPVVAEEWRNRYSALMIRPTSETKITVNQLQEILVRSVTISGLSKEISRLTPSAEENDVYTTLREVAIESVLISAASGSQIHTACLWFSEAGLPIAKLDLLYRGTASFSDILKFQNFMSHDEFLQFRALIFSRTYGGDTLVGWRRAAFFRGLI